MRCIEKKFDSLNCMKAWRRINVSALYGKISASEISCAQGMLAEAGLCMSTHMDAADAGRAHDIQLHAVH